MTDVAAALRTICLALPEAYEEPAWTGTAWRIRKKTFAHVVTIDGGWPPVYFRAAGGDGTVLTFRSSGQELAALSNAGPPFFKPRWSPAVIGVVLGDEVDWDEIAELVTESYCTVAPAKLVALVDRPDG